MNLDIINLETHFEIHEIFNIWKDDKTAILLDSSKKDSKYSNYSFIGINPFLTFKSKGCDIYIDDYKFQGDPFEELNKLIKNYKFNCELKIPLVAGAIGYFSYEMYKFTECMKSNLNNDKNIYDSYFRFYNNIIIYDHCNNKKCITSINGKKSANQIKNMIEEFNLPCDKTYNYNNDFSKFQSNFTKDGYIDAIKKMKNFIENGHTYIANMTQRFECETTQESYHIYTKLRNINPAPFSAYMSFENIDIISSSPERFINIINSVVETRPIKGTMPRSNNKDEDFNNKNILLNSEKDKSELLMVVDLLRNDLSKVCKPWSVKVEELFQIEEYATVFHLVATIKGVLDENMSAVDCMKACFPGGSITGTPKNRTLEIIEELEGLSRNLYTGSLGYFDFRGNCDFNIIIRSIIKKENKANFGVGGGITIESIEENEYNETLDKAKALMRVL